MPEERQKLAEQLAIASLTQSRCYELLGQMLHQLHRLRVSTLDAFFAQLAGSFSLELGLPTGWRIIEELHEKYLRTEAIERTLQGDSTHDVHRLLQLMAKGTAQRSVSDLVRDTVNRLYNLYMETDAAAWQQIPQPPLLSSERLATLIQELRDAVLPADKNFAKARDKDLAAAEIGDWESFIGSGLAAKVLEERDHVLPQDDPRRGRPALRATAQPGARRAAEADGGTDPGDLRSAGQVPRHLRAAEAAVGRFAV